MSEKPIIRMLSLRGKSRAGGMTGGGLNLALTALNIAADELPFDEKELGSVDILDCDRSRTLNSSFANGGLNGQRSFCDFG